MLHADWVVGLQMIQKVMMVAYLMMFDCASLVLMWNGDNTNHSMLHSQLSSSMVADWRRIQGMTAKWAAT